MGTVSDAPGLYAFTVAGRPGMRLAVMYVGMTTHPWMVTKGMLPEGWGKSGQRYGRPNHARHHASADQHGDRKSRVVRAERRAVGATASATPQGDAGGFPRIEEEKLIPRWDLRRRDWNRGLTATGHPRERESPGADRATGLE